MGRKGGKIGGKKLGANQTPEERSASARKAVQARWAKARAAKKDHIAKGVDLNRDHR